MLLEIKDLHASVDETQILKGIDLQIAPGEVHVIMGPNGSGKSTLSKLLVGHPDYQVQKGQIILFGEQIAELEPDERAHRGLFLSFQYPIEVPGVDNVEFMRLAYNAQREYRGEGELDEPAFREYLQGVCQKLGLQEEIYWNRSLNEGFSGGEKKRNEILQMGVLQPKLAILDEIDSGLDIDALKVVSNAMNQMLDGQRSLLLITHYQRLLEYVQPTHVHIMAAGKILCSGGIELVEELERFGYEPYLQQAAIKA